jgi:hypothetical protein
LKTLWASHKLTDEEKDRIIYSVAAAVSSMPAGSFEIGLATVKNFGPLFTVFTPPDDNNLSRRRVLRGQVLRFEYDNGGNVTRVFLNGEFLLSPKLKTETTSIIIPAGGPR